MTERKVVRADTSGQLPLFLDENSVASASGRLKVNARGVKFIDQDPQRCNIELKKHLQLCGLQHVFLIDEMLREQDWSNFESAYKVEGRPAYAPRSMVGLILYGVMQGKSSLRDLERLARDSLGCIWIAGGAMPDHSVIGRFIQVHARQITEEFFDSLLRSVLKHTESNVERTAGDATVVEAAASRYKTVRREALESQIEKAQQRLEQSEACSDTTEHQLKQDKARVDRLTQAEQVLAEREAKRKAQGKDSSRIMINPQESDAFNQPLKRQGYGASYKPGVIVNDKRIIIGHGVDASKEVCVALELLTQACKHGTLHESSWDAGYHSEAMLKQEQILGVSLLIPSGSTCSPDWVKSNSKQYPKSRFSYDASADTYLCPAGEIMTLEKQSHGNERTPAFKQYYTKACDTCQQRDKCTKSKTGRRIKRYEADPLREAMQEKLTDESTRERYRKRAAWVEPVFSHLQLQQGLTRFRRKGIEGVRVEFALHALAFNIGRVVALKARFIHILLIIRPYVAISLRPQRVKISIA